MVFGRNYVVAIASALGLLAGSVDGSFAAESKSGTDVGTRLVLAFDVDDNAAAAWLPDGAKLVQVGRGPFKGADMLLVMNDWSLRMDAEGNKLNTTSERGVVVAGFGIPDGAEKPRLFVMRMYSTNAESNPYNVSVAANIAHSTMLESATEGPTLRRESWSVQPARGGSFEVTLEHETGVPSWSSGTSTPYSVADPELHRTYQWSQLADVAQSEAMGKELVGEIS